MGCGSAGPTSTEVGAATPAGTVSGSWILEIEAPGPYWLGPDWFQAQDATASLESGEIQLWLGEEPVPYLLLEGPDGPGLFFSATHSPSRYAQWTAYRLDTGLGAGQVMASDSLPAATAGDSQTTAWTTRWLEQDLQYRPQISAPVPWFWEPIYSGKRITLTTELEDAIAGPITLTLGLEGRDTVAGNSAPAPIIWWAQEPVGEWQWGGQAEQSWPARLATGDRQPEVTLAVELPGQSDGRINRIWLDGWGITYRIPLSLGKSGTVWKAESDQATIAGATGARILDITDPLSPLDLGVVNGEEIPTTRGRTYWLGLPWKTAEPVRIHPQAFVDRAALDKVDYLIIAPEAFWPALQPLVEHREEQGLTVSLLTPAQVYEPYGDGRPSPDAIRSLVRELHSQERLDYLLLVGDASTRPDGYAGQEGELRIVTDLVPTAHLYETPSDQTLVIGPGGLPLVAVGRFPAETPAEVQTMVRKTIAWEETELVTALVVNDDQADFGQFAQDVEDWLEAETQRVEAAQENARPELLEKLEREGTWLNYVGHGSLSLWGDEKLLRREDRWSQPALVTVWACLSGYFVHPQEDSLAEVWLRSPQGGAVAFVGPTGETYLHQQRPLARTFYQEIRKGKTVGDALLLAWQAAGDAAQDAVHGYLLLGDPALRLNLP